MDVKDYAHDTCKCGNKKVKTSNRCLSCRLKGEYKKKEPRGSPLTQRYAYARRQGGWKYSPLLDYNPKENIFVPHMTKRPNKITDVEDDD